MEDLHGVNQQKLVSIGKTRSFRKSFLGASVFSQIDTIFYFLMAQEFKTILKQI